MEPDTSDVYRLSTKTRTDIYWYSVVALSVALTVPGYFMPMRPDSRTPLSILLALQTIVVLGIVSTTIRYHVMDGATLRGATLRMSNPMLYRTFDVSKLTKVKLGPMVLPYWAGKRGYRKLEVWWGQERFLVEEYLMKGLCGVHPSRDGIEFMTALTAAMQAAHPDKSVEIRQFTETSSYGRPVPAITITVEGSKIGDDGQRRS